ncbi:MAG: FAD-dependent monooxygenase [Alphaproteobacteria bacterium]|nr:FAD-dependent monooxygenase [Alphaproteobacteria bacterium]
MPADPAIKGDIDIPVLIVGGGPVGLAMAVELGWRGIACVLVEQGDGEVVHPKTNGVNMRTMEYCRRWGIADVIREKGYPRGRPRDHIYFTTLTGWEIARQTNPPYEEARPPRGCLEAFQRCPQTVFDPALQERARSLEPVTLRYHVRCLGVEQDDTGVTAKLQRVKEDGAEETLRAAYVVACEGARSPIRDALGIRLQGMPVLGYSTNVLFRSAEFATMHDKGEGRSYLAVGPDGQWASVNSINGEDIWRFQVRGSLDPDSWAKVDVDADLRRFAGRDFDYETLSVLEWIRRQLVADRYQDGRILLAGDCVHQLTPAGSFGMNTGIGDVTNLSWKIEAALDGWAGDGLLDSYTAERRPIGKRNVDFAAARYARGEKITPTPHILEDSPEGERERKEVGERIMNEVVNPPTFGLQIGYRYDDSPVICLEPGPPPPVERESYSPTTRPGARAPDARLADGRALIDLFGKGFTLLRLGAAPPEPDALVKASSARGVPLTAHDIAEPGIADLYESPLVLVRPDGHVAWRGDAPPDDPTAVIDKVRGAH